MTNHVLGDRYWTYFDFTDGPYIHERPWLNSPIDERQMKAKRIYKTMMAAERAATHERKKT